MRIAINGISTALATAAFLLISGGSSQGFHQQARGQHADQAVCAAAPEDEHQIIQTIETMFAAATTDDLVKIHSVTSPDFYAFDNGKEFTGDALMQLVKKDHQEGVVYFWSVNDPQVHVHCDSAWISYTNKGYWQDSKGKVNMDWLESAFLLKDGGTWKVHFMQSTRVPKK